MSSRPRWLARTGAACLALAALSAGVVAGTAGASTSRSPVAPQVTRFAVAVTANHYRLAADGKSTAAIAVRVLRNGRAVDDAFVTLSVQFRPGGTSAACGTFSSSGGRTNANGFFRSTYTASTSSGFCDITASYGSHSGGATIIQENPAYAGVGLTISESSPNPDLIVADGKSTSTFTVTVADNAGPVANDAVELHWVGDCGSLSPSSAFTGANGALQVTYTASTTPGSCRFWATEAFGGLSSAREAIVQRRTAATVSAVNLSASPRVIVASGKSTSTVSVKVFGSNGDGFGDATVVLSVAYSPTSTTATCGALSRDTVRTDSLGVARVGYRSSTKAGFCVVTATSDGVSGSTVIVQRNPGFTVSLSSPSPATVAADGKSTSTFTVSVASTLGPVSGDPVEIFGTPSKAGSCGTLSPNEANTDASGNVSVTYTSSSSAGVCHVRATEALTAQTSSAVDITQT
jgi:hypothetical protein